jgi:hypothetical protein
VDEEQKRVSDALRRIRDEVRDRADAEPLTLPAAREPRAPEAAPREAEPERQAPPPRPDAAAVNAQWDTAKAAGGGLLGRPLQPFADAQAAWNARQVQLDNALLEWIEARFDATHRHYDHVLGLYGRRMADIDERHLILQEELVAHVHDLVKRIDLTLAQGEKGRLGLEFALRDVRGRLASLEERLKKP